MRPHAQAREGQGRSSLPLVVLLLLEVLPPMNRSSQGDSNGGSPTRNIAKKSHWKIFQQSRLSDGGRGFRR